MKFLKSIFWFLYLINFCRADIEIAAAPIRLSAGKVSLNLALKNTFDQPLKEARVWVFFLDIDGKVLANKAQWLIGGPDTPKSWGAGETQQCLLQIEVPRPVASTKITFSRLTLADGTEIDPQKRTKTINSQPK